MADRSMVTPPQPKVISLQGPPGYPLLFPELSNEDPRIERVRQGHVYSYEKQNMNSAGKALAIKESRGAWAREVQSDGEVESSGSHMSNHSAPVQVPTVFRLGPSAEGLTTGNAGSSKAQRRRPPAWKRRSSLKLISVSAQTEAGCSVSVPSASKRKPRMISSEGFEDLVRESWERKSCSQNRTMDRIRRCRKNTVPRPPNYRHDSVVDLTLTVDTLIDQQTGSWNFRRVRETIADDDVERVLATKIFRGKDDSLRWGFASNGVYNTKSEAMVDLKIDRVFMEVSSGNIQQILSQPSFYPYLSEWPWRLQEVSQGIIDNSLTWRTRVQHGWSLEFGRKL
ncbi:hypothetical protein IGI04_035180 [Brassica rapa subsp. trilocularis]|uniref:Uncharacterized protein n=1 Tax=Brassica rapa subsp. trilocularis TaxID=1813537 RepID=A0ABQ7LDM4_BRACM|nr:hypothetical protein IGI04_035180 [Brassica rapa subsp. trilocularis]